MLEHASTPTSEDTCFDCVVVGDHLQCRSSETLDQVAIHIDDILCVLPNRDERAYQYALLFFRKDANSPNAPPKLERLYVKTAPSAFLSHWLISGTPYSISHPSNKRTEVHVIISTASGTGNARLLFNSVLKPLFAYLGLGRYGVHETQSSQTITELCRSLFIPQAEADVQQTIVLLSGDGGLCDIIDAFYNTPKTLLATPNIALFPAGTGNAMASSTGLLAHLKAPSFALLHGKPCPIPVFIATFSRHTNYVQEGQAQSLTAPDGPCSKMYGGVVASWGIHSALVADSDTVEYRKFGADRFKMAANELLFPSDGSESHRYTGTVTLIKKDDHKNLVYREVLEPTEHMYVLATLVSNLEKDFMISPHSAPLDGSLRMIRFGPMSAQRAMQVLSSAYERGQHVHDGDVTYSEIEGFRIDFHELDKRWRRVCIDGRVVTVEEGGWMEVHKEERYLLNILLPDTREHV
ncbi:ATP-NAD kinase-like domain-containing protein [Aspergillus lucknowensis]|uniref:ATP-NAD kinase-like domain-containing protein n=1 Tax=Aspergillus lucknowensis TaxID=176173 RepID=A0ABR4M6K5_9EURO